MNTNRAELIQPDLFFAPTELNLFNSILFVLQSRVEPAQLDVIFARVEGASHPMFQFFNLGALPFQVDFLIQQIELSFISNLQCLQIPAGLDHPDGWVDDQYTLYIYNFRVEPAQHEFSPKNGVESHRILCFEIRVEAAQSAMNLSWISGWSSNSFRAQPVQLESWVIFFIKSELSRFNRLFNQNNWAEVTRCFALKFKWGRRFFFEKSIWDGQTTLKWPICHPLKNPKTLNSHTNRVEPTVETGWMMTHLYM